MLLCHSGCRISIWRCMSSTDVLLSEEVSKYYADPLGFVMFAFEWGVKGSPLEGFDGPDEWQRDLLIQLGEEIQRRKFNGVDPVDPIQFATASGHGIGKSALTAWLILFIMSTRAHSKGVVTANTGDQLKTKTWSELGKWRRLCITGHWFEVTATCIYHKLFCETWRADAQTCREENSESFAGLHAANSTPWYIFDEASGVPKKIWEVAKGGLTDGEPMFFAFGNPTRNDGEFFDMFGKFKHRWITNQIDSRTCKMTNKRLIDQYIEDYGEDSDWVRVRVRGRFPKAGDMQFIPSDVVAEAQKRSAGRYLGDDPLICGVDLARGGSDNCMIQFRRGNDAVSEKVYRIPGEKSRDSMRVVSLLVTVLDRHKPDITFVDETGLGGPIADRLSQLGYNVMGVNFGSNADDVQHFRYKVGEMWSRMREWLMAGGAITDDPQLEAELTRREYGHNEKDQLILEKKKDMAVSPDWADALALTFAHPVPPRMIPRGDLDAAVGIRETVQSIKDYDPLDGLSR